MNYLLGHDSLLVTEASTLSRTRSTTTGKQPNATKTDPKPDGRVRDTNALRNVKDGKLPTAELEKIITKVSKRVRRPRDISYGPWPVSRSKSVKISLSKEFACDLTLASDPDNFDEDLYLYLRGSMDRAMPLYLNPGDVVLEFKSPSQATYGRAGPLHLRPPDSHTSPKVQQRGDLSLPVDCASSLSIVKSAMLPRLICLNVIEAKWRPLWWLDIDESVRWLALKKGYSHDQRLALFKRVDNPRSTFQNIRMNTIRCRTCSTMHPGSRLVNFESSYKICLKGIRFYPNFIPGSIMSDDKNLRSHSLKDGFLCYYCERILPQNRFAKGQSSGEFLPGHAKALSRFCIACGIVQKILKPGNRVTIQNLPFQLCKICSIPTLGRFCEKCNTCGSCLGQGEYTIQPTAKCPGCQTKTLKIKVNSSKSEVLKSVEEKIYQVRALINVLGLCMCSNCAGIIEKMRWKPKPMDIVWQGVQFELYHFSKISKQRLDHVPQHWPPAIVRGVFDGDAQIGFEDPVRNVLEYSELPFHCYLEQCGSYEELIKVIVRERRSEFRPP